MSQKTINNRLSLAEYDLNPAEAMFQTKRYLYVAFMWQQAIEKLLKAGYVKARSSTPRTRTISCDSFRMFRGPMRPAFCLKSSARESS